MRTLVLIAALLLAGCTGPAAVDSTAEAVTASSTDPGPAVLAEPKTLMEGDHQWHLDAAGANGNTAVDAVEMAAQPVFPDCVTETDGEPYITNRHLGAPAGVPPGTTGIEVALDWTQQDYLGDRLVLAYRHNESTAWTESPYVTNGLPLVIEITPDMWDEGRLSAWDLYLCTTRDPDNYPGTPDHRPTLVTGSIHVVLTALP